MPTDLEDDGGFARNLREIVERDRPMMERLAGELCDTRELEKIFGLEAPEPSGEIPHIDPPAEEPPHG
jgi:hypothetical protein